MVKSKRVQRAPQNYRWNYIKNGWAPRHKFIKEELNSLNESELMDEAENERSLLLNKINEINLTRMFEEDLIIFDRQNEAEPEEVEASENYRLFKGMKSLTLWDKKWNKRYSKAQKRELEELLDKYPNKHQSIRKFLEIPSSTFHMMKKDLFCNKDAPRPTNVDKSSSVGLEDKEKIFIRKLLNPPAFPITILEI